MTPLEHAKKDFEETVQQQQADLIAYAGRPSSNAKAVETRKTNLNKLVEYYTQVELYISELEMQLMEMHLGYTKLHTDAGKLVQLCQLHNVEPNMVFQFTTEELDTMLSYNIRVQPPRVTLSHLRFEQRPAGDIRIVEPAEPTDPDHLARIEPYINKYYNVLARIHAQKVR